MSWFSKTGASFLSLLFFVWLLLQAPQDVNFVFILCSMVVIYGLLYIFNFWCFVSLLVFLNMMNLWWEKKKKWKESEKPTKAGNFELGKKLPHCQAAHTNIVYKYSLLLFFFFSFLGFKTKVSRSFHTVWFRFAMDDVRASSAWVTTHSSHVVVDSVDAWLKIWFFACVSSVAVILTMLHLEAEEFWLFV